MRKRSTTPSTIDIKRQVRARDGHRCTKCGITVAEYKQRHGRTLDVHRLTPGSLYSVQGCVTLCRGCHGPEPKRGPGAPDLANPRVDQTQAVRIRGDLFEMAKVYCFFSRDDKGRRPHVSTYIENLIRDRVKAEFLAVVERLRGQVK